jgi:hypothetical protein
MVRVRVAGLHGCVGHLLFDGGKTGAMSDQHQRGADQGVQCRSALLPNGPV